MLVALVLNPLFVYLSFFSSLCFALTIDANLDASSLASALSSPYTHIVVGGGNTGLALASRLSEATSNTVLCLEAGTSHATEPGVIIPGMAGSTFGSSFDWAFATKPQPFAGNRVVSWPRGKGLGGSTLLHFMAWTRGFAADYDAWTALAGNSAWNYKSLFAFLRKSERAFPPGPNIRGVARGFNGSAHGSTGPVKASQGSYLSEQFVAFYNTMTALNISVDPDSADGVGRGVGYSMSSIDPSVQSRVTSENSYLAGASARPNLVVVTSARVTKVMWSSQAIRGLVVASGVQFVADGSSAPAFSASASKEVILSAGAVQTPQLLELSGIGNPSIINPLGIPTVVALPGVGENLQDHPTVVSVYELVPGSLSLDGLAGEALSAALADYALGGGVLSQAISVLGYLPAQNFLSSSEISSAQSLLQVTNPALSSKQQTQTWNVLQAGSPVIELVPINAYFGNSSGASGKSYLSIASCLQHSLSRGSIHISSSDPLSPPTIDPAYLQHPSDRFFLAKSAAFVRKLTQTVPLASFIAAETEPGSSVLNDNDLAAWIGRSVRTEYHPIGTAAMMPSADKGVVNSQLLVHGTANLRVADLSVMPIHISTHPQTIAYAIAERAAAFILG